MKKSDDLINCAKVFLTANTAPNVIFNNGLHFLLAVYRAPKNLNSIDILRYSIFFKSTRFNKAVQLISLPPTSAAAQYHFYRVYYQVQTWLGNDAINPEDWEWTLKNNVLEPITTLLQPAPDVLLSTIFCNCRKDCGSNCGCRKAGLKCSIICSHCHGQACLNTVTPDINEEEINDDVDPSSLLEQCFEIEN